MNRTVRLPITETIVPSPLMYHRDELIRESCRNGVIPDVGTNGFDWRVVHASETIERPVDQTIPRTAQDVRVLVGGSVLFLT